MCEFFFLFLSFICAKCFKYEMLNLFSLQDSSMSCEKLPIQLERLWALEIF